MLREQDTGKQWKQINFRSVKTVLGMEFLQELYNRYEPDLNCLRFRNTVIRTDGRQVTSYAPAEEWRFMGRWFSERFKRGDEALWDNLEQYLTRDRDRLKRFLTRMEELDLTALDDAELATTLIDTQYIPLTELYGVNHVQLEHALDIAIDDLLQHHFSDDEFNRAKAALIFAEQVTIGVEEEQAFYEVVADGVASGVTHLTPEDDNPVADQVRAHHDQYQYVHSAYGAEPYPFSYYIERYNDLADEGEEALRRKIQQIEDGAAESRARKQEYLDQISDDPVLQRNLELMAGVGTLRDQHKALLGRTTRHREAVLNEIARRTDVPREELNWYFLAELCDLLDNGDQVDDATLTDRQDGMVLVRWEHADPDGEATFKVVEEETQLEGTCASPGTYEGKITIVETSEDGNKMHPGDIMVAPGTDFDLINAMQRAGAIITEEGGILSHAAVISRELGTPCVIGVTDATDRLKEGSMVRVDADTGDITPLGDSL